MAAIIGTGIIVVVVVVFLVCVAACHFHTRSCMLCDGTGMTDKGECTVCSGTGEL